MKYKLKEARKFEWANLKGWAYDRNGAPKDISAAYIETRSSHGKTKNLKSVVTYFVIDGKGEFFTGNKWVGARSKDMVIIPKNTVYDFRPSRGEELKLFVTHTPASSPKDEIHLE